MRKVEFVNGEYYHIYNRGVDKRPIFKDEKDYCRFVQGLYVFNNQNLVEKPFYYDFLKTVEIMNSTRRPLVDILSWCLMPNHFHFLARQIVEDGIPKFIQKLANSFTKYFNIKYGRSGYLFEGAYQAKLVDEEIYFTHVSRYIHLNHLELCEPEWKDGVVKDAELAKRFLVEYTWSSLRDYIAEKPSIFLPVINRALIIKVFDGDLAKYKDFVSDWNTAVPLREDLLGLSTPRVDR